MPTTLRGHSSKAVKGRGESRRSVALVLFGVGGRRIAVRADEVCGVWPWNDQVTVPSTTPFITAILRRGEDIFPVFDLASRLNVDVKGESPLCLVARRRDGVVAICIDSDVPLLQVVEESAIRPVIWKDSDVEATCRIGVEEVPLYSLASLGLNGSNSALESGGEYAKNPGRG